MIFSIALLKPKRKISTLPATEQQLLSIQRRYEVNGTQYQLLLEEPKLAYLKPQICLTQKSLTQARFRGQLPTGPNRLLNYLLALTLGFVLPSTVILVSRQLNTKILSVQDVEAWTSIPVAGIVPHSKYDSNLVVLTKPKSSTAGGVPCPAFTHGILGPHSHEGSWQSACGYILCGRRRQNLLVNQLDFCSFLSATRVILVGMDLRKPKIFNDFGLANEVGLSTYLAGGAEIPDIIQPSGFFNMDIISAGIVPPNPSELIQRPRFKTLIEDLKRNYHYVILDTPPIGFRRRFTNYPLY